MPDLSTIGLGLLWFGLALLVGVLAYRARLGAWSEDSFEEPPPLSPWTKATAAVALLCAFVGGGISIGVLL